MRTPVLTIIVPQKMAQRYDERELQGAARQAQKILKLPGKQLKHNPKGNLVHEEAKYYALMSLALQARFNHLGATGKSKEAVQALFDQAKKLADQISSFPNFIEIKTGQHLFTGPLNTKADIYGWGLQETTSRTIFKMVTGQANGLYVASQELTEDLGLARARAIIFFMYNWCQISGETKPFFPLMYRTTLTSERIKECMSLSQRTLIPLAANFHPLPYFVVEATIINPETEVPFNITI
ncbi:MAG: hypothetical protein ABIH69_04760 [bacterium]